ncbi:MAG TPA: Ig-like domain-containing protein [Kineosporiaceae bacterium]|nr:Ig-like domain-containing protein [Kineosporiaceae bacterium]
MDADRRRARRKRDLVLTSGAVALAVLATACSSSGGHSTTGASGSSSAAAASTTPPVKSPTMKVSGGAGAASYLNPVQLVVSDGSFASVQTTSSDGQALDGGVSGDGASWSSEEPPKPGATYTVNATLKDSDGQTRTATTTFTVAQVPSDQRVAFSVTPADRSTVGIGQPVVVRFLTPVTQRADVEKVLLVDARTADGKQVTGSWHWLGNQEVHWRPQDFWTPGTKVTLDMKIAGVKFADNRFGRKDYSQSFTIGASHITRYDASTKRLRVYQDGKLVNDFPSGSGKTGLETYSGTYIVLGKAQVVKMDSCSARITCDKQSPEYYDEKEYWATRLTASGTFVHAAGWDPLIGKANVSHGCIHLSDANAQDFYKNAVVGDVVIVTNTGRGAQERIKTQDPGLIDWNLSWAAWTAGSALH